MKSRDFCYWLQGFFELTNLNESEQQYIYAHRKCIITHLNLVIETNRLSPESNSGTLDFVKELHDLLSNLGHLEEVDYDKIKTKLSWIFHHVVDPTFGDQNVQDSLNKIHNEEDYEIAPRC
jgi:hypothetical protein